MKNNKLLITLSCLGVGLATQASAGTIDFQEHGSNIDLGPTTNFTVGSSSITASGFTTAGATSDLFAKLTSGNPNETGLGMNDDPTDHEINGTLFIQLNFSKLVPTTSAILDITSVQSGETATVYRTTTPGSLSGAIPITTLTADGTVDVTTWVNQGYLIDVTGGGGNPTGAGNVLIATLFACANSFSLTAPNPLPVCGSSGNQLTGPAGMATYAWSILSPPDWVITGGGNTQTVTYTAGASGPATFQLVVTDSDGCPATNQVTFGCNAPPPLLGCRVTGGSNKQLNTFQSQCVITPPPTFISHGGQVGAPHAGEAEFSPYSVCISGSWEHDRHLTQNSLVGVLKASGQGNEHDFDSLLCACLPCDTTPGAVGTVGSVCNPNDKNCGPLPSKAPANKICFSGVGDWTDTTGPKTIKAVFRVDVEDRSEGNSQSSAPPPDRYRIRIWLLGTPCHPFGPDSAAGLALRFAVSADAALIGSEATTEMLRDPSTAGSPDIDDGGDLTQGNEQIHPQTGATCP
jgi:hypothetical protein